MDELINQRNTIERNISQVNDPTMLYEMNKKYRDLEKQIDKLIPLINVIF